MINMSIYYLENIECLLSYIIIILYTHYSTVLLDVIFIYLFLIFYLFLIVLFIYFKSIIHF